MLHTECAMKTSEQIKSKEDVSGGELFLTVFGERREFKCSLCSEGHGAICQSSLHPVLFYDMQNSLSDQEVE